jgi:hypothetical protein
MKPRTLENISDFSEKSSFLLQGERDFYVGFESNIFL